MKSKTFWMSVWADVLANTASGILIAFLAVVTIDHFYETPQLGGMWEFTIEVDESSYKAYQGMRVTYQAVLLQKELQFNGNGDKFSEKALNDTKTIEHQGKARVPIDITGYIEKNFLSDNKVFISITEEGSRRQSASFHELSIISEDELEGNFFSTIANIKGRVKWKRTKRGNQ